MGLLAGLIWRARAVVHPPVTLGVRLAVFDVRGSTVMVRHTYVAGWHFPGGGVDPGETTTAAAVREFREETGLEVIGEPVLFGLYLSLANAARDHVALFVLRDHPLLDAGKMKPQATEIAEAMVVTAADPPNGVTAPTARRLGELLDGQTPSLLW